MLKRFGFYLITLFGIVMLHIVIRKSLIIMGISPNILLIVVIFVALIKGIVFGQLFGFTFGLITDTLSIGPFGTNAFLFTLISFLSGLMSRKLNITQPKAQVVFVFLLSLIYIFGLFLVLLIFSDSFGVFPSLKIWFEPFLNAFFSPILYFVLRKWIKIWFPRQKIGFLSVKKYNVQ
ncbi:MAG: rod shape-determining protein MreD [bacterium]